MEACRPDQMRTNRAKRGFAHISEVASKPDALTPSGRLGFSRNSDLAPHPPPSFGPRGCSGSDIAPLHFADYPMEQAGSHHFVLAKVCRDVIKEGVAVRYRQGFGGFHRPGEIVVGQAQSQLVEWGHSKLPKKGECCNPDLVRLPAIGNSLNATALGLARPRQPFPPHISAKIRQFQAQGSDGLGDRLSVADHM
jgi:hypothetical protein